MREWKCGFRLCKRMIFEKKLYQMGDDSHLYRDATEKLLLHTIYSSEKHINILYLVLFCAK